MNQKRNKSRLIAVCLAILVMFCSTLSMSAANEEASVDVTSIDELIAAQAQAVAANEALMQYFFENGRILEYPEYFSSCYIEANILHIRLVSPTNQEMDTLHNVLANFEDAVIYEYGRYSQQDLQELADITAAELGEQGCEVTHWYVDSVTGNIIIGVLSDDVDSANALIENQQTYSLENAGPEIVIEEGAYTSTTTAPTVYGGSTIVIGTSMRSAGVCGYYGGKNALVTCGHGNTTVGSSVKLGTETIGTVKKVQYSNGGKGDYSIIQLDNAVLSHKIGSSTKGYVTITGGTYLSPAVGTYVTKYGFMTGYSYGTVSATNVSTQPADDMIIKGMTEVVISKGYGSISGDSGGPYLVGNAFCGVHCGSNETNSKTVYFTPYSIISNGGFTAIGKHDCLSWIDDGYFNHRGYCKICKETIYEMHINYWDAVAGKCTRCGRTDPVANVLE